MVTDNSNFCRFRLNSFLLPFPTGEEKHNYCLHRNNRFMLFFVPTQFKLSGMLAYLQTTGYLHYSAAHSQIFESVLSVGVFFCTSDDEWFLVALRDRYLQDTVHHIKSKQNTNALSTLPGIVP